MEVLGGDGLDSFKLAVPVGKIVIEEVNSIRRFKAKLFCLPVSHEVQETKERSKEEDNARDSGEGAQKRPQAKDTFGIESEKPILFRRLDADVGCYACLE